MRPLMLVTASAAAVLITLTGCASAPPRTAESTVSSSPASATAAPATAPAAAPADGLSDGLVPPPDDPLPAGDDKKAVAFAVDAMRHFADDLPQQQWLDGMLPYLSERTAKDFAYTDPARIPIDHVGAGRMLNHPIAIVVRVAVQTDDPEGDGQYMVSLSRHSVSERWMVDAITQPSDWVNR